MDWHGHMRCYGCGVTDNGATSWTMHEVEQLQQSLKMYLRNIFEIYFITTWGSFLMGTGDIIILVSILPSSNLKPRISISRPMRAEAEHVLCWFLKVPAVHVFVACWRCLELFNNGTFVLHSRSNYNIHKQPSFVFVMTLSLMRAHRGLQKTAMVAAQSIFVSLCQNKSLQSCNDF